MKKKFKNAIINEVCSRCGGKLVGDHNDSIMGLRCLKCGEWEVVASYFPDYYYDDTVYSIYIKANKSLPFEKLKYIAKKSQKSCIKIKDELSKGDIFLKKVGQLNLKRILLI